MILSLHLRRQATRRPAVDPVVPCRGLQKIAKQNAKPFKGGLRGVHVQWEYLAITEVLPVYEEIADGAEIAWMERTPSKAQNTLKAGSVEVTDPYVAKVRPNPGIERTSSDKPAAA